MCFTKEDSINIKNQENNLHKKYKENIRRKIETHVEKFKLSKNIQKKKSQHAFILTDQTIKKINVITKSKGNSLNQHKQTKFEKNGNHITKKNENVDLVLSINHLLRNFKSRKKV